MISCSSDTDKVLIHDAARPLVSHSIIARCINALDAHDAISTIISSADTIYETDINSNLISIPVRVSLKRVQTPQGFKLEIIKQAHLLAIGENKSDFSDDAGMVFYYKLAQVFLVEGEESNIKITYPHDLIIAKELLDQNEKHSLS